MAQYSNPKLRLHGFNNLTKSLSFNIYDVAYAKTPAEHAKYIEYIDEEFNAERLTQILTNVSSIIGANILNVARQDYDPQGASVTILISEEPVAPVDHDPSEEQPGPIPEDDTELVIHKESVVGHLDKSHITVHTYPESHPDKNISTFRADIDVSTCGVISPLKALNYLIHSFDSDIVTMDYRVRGFTREVDGQKLFIDHEITSIQNFMDDETLQRYSMIDTNVYQENIFHTKMHWSEFDLDRYVFGEASKQYSEAEREEISANLKHEMDEIFYQRNMPSMK